MEVLDQTSPVSYNNPFWKINTLIEQTTPTYCQDTGRDREIIAPACRIKGANIIRSTISYSTVIEPNTWIENSIIMAYDKSARMFKILNSIITGKSRFPMACR
jgi:ADP-glucose pyrophosphorylase